MRKTLFTALLLATSALNAAAQNENGNNGITVTGSIQSDILIPQNDEKIGAVKDDDWAKTNTYAEVNAMSKHLDAGVMRCPWHSAQTAGRVRPQPAVRRGNRLCK